MRTRSRTIFLGTILFTLIAAISWNWSRPVPKHVDNSAIINTVDVKDSYTLNWRASDTADALRLNIPAVDFGQWYKAENTPIQETADGPRFVPLEFPVPGPDGALTEQDAGCSTDALANKTCMLDAGSMLLSRDALHGNSNTALTRAFAPKGQNKPDEAVWINQANDAWVFLGFDCSATAHDESNADHGDTDSANCFEPTIKQRLIGGWFGLRKIPLETINGACTRTFLYHGHSISITSQTGCENQHSRHTFKVGMQVLQRLVQDTAVAPTPDLKRERSQRALTTCLTADQYLSKENNANDDGAKFRAGFLCGYALQLLRERLPAAAEEVAPKMIDIMKLDSYNHSAQFRWDRWYAEEIIDALTKAGKPNSPSAIRAREIQFTRLAVGYKAEEIDAARQSLGALAAQVPQLTTLDFDLFEFVEQFLWIGVKVDDRYEQTRAFLRAWYDKADSLDPESDAALKIKNSVCRDMTYHRFERSVLKQCADALTIGWEKRVNAGIPMTFEKNSWLASNIVNMYVGYAEETQDFNGGLEGLQRFEKFFAQSLQNDPDAPTMQKDIDEVSAYFAAHGVGGAHHQTSTAPR
jgi:hypothetical protein